MRTRNCLLIAFCFIFLCGKLYAQPTGSEDRMYWVQTLTRIADPVLVNLSQGTLKKNMPFESLSDEPLRRSVSYLEAVGRTVCGIAPWLELGPDDTQEGKLRERYIQLVVKGLKQAVDPQSADYLMFDNRHSQPLVDAAFLVQGLLRAPRQLWGNLDVDIQKKLVYELKRTRGIKPNESNWLLFASMVEAALLEFTGEYDSQRLYYGVNRFIDEWYKGDAWYGDGAELHLDYYNSLVIHPMLTDVLYVMKKHGLERAEFLERQLVRQQRMAAQLERMISPEATYPVVGRSIVYRFGAFHALSQIALLDKIPQSLSKGQIRSALTAVMQRQISMPGTFDENGWLKIGFSGSQINMSEPYINTGSLYMCTAVFLPLGLPANHPFWTEPYSEWTSILLMSLDEWSGFASDVRNIIQEEEADGWHLPTEEEAKVLHKTFSGSSLDELNETIEGLRNGDPLLDIEKRYVYDHNGSIYAFGFKTSSKFLQAGSTVKYKIRLVCSAHYDAG